MIKALFRKARETSPSIIFFDEFDALGTTRGQPDSAGVQKNIIAQILGELDGIQELHDVYIMGATNRPDMIDPALLRPGRFDEVIEISRPNREAGEQILEVYLNEEIPIDADLVDEHGSEEAAAAYLREQTLDAIYGEDQWIEFKAEESAQESLKTIKRQDVVSGALLESIVRTAKKNYVKRAMEHEKGSTEREREGIEVDDLLEAVEEESKEHALVESSVYALRQRERDRFRDQGAEIH
jgi:SpoVK/Ycf46/Vps4 family AAA+-type ATPase